MSMVSATQSSPSGVKPFAYQEVDGLQEIYVGAGANPSASFVFASKEQANAAHGGVAQACKVAYMIGHGRQYTDDNLKGLLEILRSSNLSPIIDDERVLSFCAKPGPGGTVGAPLKTVHGLLKRVGEAMRAESPSKEIHAVPIYVTDDHLNHDE